MSDIKMTNIPSMNVGKWLKNYQAPTAQSFNTIIPSKPCRQ